VNGLEFLGNSIHKFIENQNPRRRKNGGKVITLVHLLDRVSRPTRGFASEGAGSETVGEAVRQEESAGSRRDEVPRKNRRFREERVRGRSRTQRNGKEKQTEVKVKTC